MSGQKDVFVTQATIVASAISQSLDNIQALVSVYYDRQYNTGGTNELTTGDLAAFGITPVQMAAFVTLGEQLQHMRNGQAVSTTDYDATLNVLRRDL